MRTAFVQVAPQSSYLPTTGCRIRVSARPRFPIHRNAPARTTDRQVVPRLPNGVTPQTLKSLGELYDSACDRGVYFHSHLNDNRPGNGEADQTKSTYQLNSIWTATMIVQWQQTALSLNMFRVLRAQLPRR